MRIFLTGATGFIGSRLVPRLIREGHTVIGLTRSDAGAAALHQAGAVAFKGDVTDLSRLRQGAADADGIIHMAFNHDFANLKQASENDRKAIEALGEMIRDPSKPFIVTSGTGLARSTTGQPVVETDGYASANEFARGATEEAADGLIAQGKRVIVVRLPQVHDASHFGRIGEHIKLAIQKGVVAYIGKGGNSVPAAHVTDVAELFQIAIKHGRAGARYHAVAEESVKLREIAEAIGARLSIPVASLSSEEGQEYFGWLATLAGADLPASGAATRHELAWRPTGPSLLADIRPRTPPGF